MRIVITGGSFSGKTTVLNYLEKEGYAVLPDVGLLVMEELNKKLGIEEQRKFRVQNPGEFYALIARKQFELEKKFLGNGEVSFFDRGMHDWVAFCRLAGVHVPGEILKLVSKVKYDFVFVFETLSSFEPRRDTGRLLTRSDSLKIRDLIQKTYEENGYKVIYVKEDSVENRIKFVKDKLGL